MNIDVAGLFHPRFAAIESFALGHTNERDRVGLAGHLLDCALCQDRVRELRELRASTRGAYVPPVPAGLRARVVAGARAGSPGIIPSTAYERPRAHRLRGPWVAIIVAAAVIAFVLLVPGRGLDAGPTAGTLRIMQRTSTPAPSFAVTYVPPVTFHASDRMVLKVRTYKAGEYFVPIARDFTLTRATAGVLAADVTLPTGTVFAQYSVASADGNVVDDNDARGWEVTVRDSASRPLFQGLSIQRAVNALANWERSWAAAKAMLMYYPDNPASIRAAVSDEMQLAGPSRADSIVRLYGPRVEALHRKLTSAPLDATTMWEMAMLGSAIGDTVMVRQWRQRMMREYPTDAGTIQQRVFAVSGTGPTGEQRMRELDRIWEETGGQGVQLLANAFDLALQLGDSANIARWGERLLKFGGPYKSMVPLRYAAIPAFRARGVELLRESLRSLPAIPATDWGAALRNAGVRGRSSGQPASWQLQALGRALFEAGHIEAARDTLSRAASLEWDARTLRSLGDANLAGGDSVGAMKAYAWAVADSRTPLPLSDTLRARLGSRAHGPTWDGKVSEGRALIAAQTLKTAIRRPFETRGTFSDASGARRTLANAIGKRVSVVAFVSPSCAPSLADLASLDAVATKLAPRDVPVIALVGDEKPSSTIVALLAKRGFKGPLGFDDRAEVSRSMRQAGTPTYFVVEEGRLIRFSTHRAEDLMVLVEALQTKR